MECVEFEALVATIDMDDIRAIAAGLDATATTPAEEIAAMRATLAVEHALRRSGRQTQAALAARAVGATVQDAARRERVRLPDDSVTRVARAAGQVVRALTAGDSCAAEARLFAEVFSHSSTFAKVPLDA
jgi:hypothetical protein